MKIETVKTALGEIEYSITGKGKPILFMHGGHSNCRETLFHKGFDLTKYQLITPSRPGYGNTPMSHHDTAKNAADLIISLLDYLNLDKVMVYAISAGGLTAIEIAGNYPQKVEKLILASAVTKKWLNNDDKVYKTAKIMFDPKMEKITWAMVRLASRLFPRIIANNFYPQFSSNPPHKLADQDIRELLAAFKHYNSRSGFINDIDQDVEKRFDFENHLSYAYHS